MAATEEPLLSINERDFLLTALAEGQRADGRFLLERRRVRVSFERSEGKAVCEVQLGDTLALAVLTATISAPFPDRPTEGLLVLNVEVPPMAGAQYEPGRPTPAAVELGRLLERQIRDARALDVEALCITPGEAVWALRCDVRVLDDGGNLPDAVGLAAIGAFLHFRRADVSVEGDRVVVHPYASRAPVPLAVHHIPVCVTFGLSHAPLSKLSLEAAARRRAAAATSAAALTASDADDAAGGGTGGVVVFLDPTGPEAAVGDGRVTFVVNAHHELCGLHKLGGAPLPPTALLAAAKLAGEKAVELVGLLKTALADAEKAAAERARARHAAAAGFGVADALTADGGAGAGAAAAAAPGAAKAAAGDGKQQRRKGGAGGLGLRVDNAMDEDEAVAGSSAAAGAAGDSDDEDDESDGGGSDVAMRTSAAAAAASVAAAVESTISSLGVGGKRKVGDKRAAAAAGGVDLTAAYAQAQGTALGGGGDDGGDGDALAPDAVVKEMAFARADDGGSDAPDEAAVFARRGGGQPG